MASYRKCNLRIRRPALLILPGGGSNHPIGVISLVRGKTMGQNYSSLRPQRPPRLLEEFRLDGWMDIKLLMVEGGVHERQKEHLGHTDASGELKMMHIFFFWLFGCLNLITMVIMLGVRKKSFIGQV